MFAGMIFTVFDAVATVANSINNNNNNNNDDNLNFESSSSMAVSGNVNVANQVGSTKAVTVDKRRIFPQGESEPLEATSP